MGAITGAATDFVGAFTTRGMRTTPMGGRAGESESDADDDDGEEEPEDDDLLDEALPDPFSSDSSFSKGSCLDGTGTTNETSDFLGAALAGREPESERPTLRDICGFFTAGIAEAAAGGFTFRGIRVTPIGALGLEK